MDDLAEREAHAGEDVGEVIKVVRELRAVQREAAAVEFYLRPPSCYVSYPLILT